MKTAIVIPARYASVRYPGKPLVMLAGCDGQSKTLIRRSWEAACAVPGADRVLVSTDDGRIADAARDFGADVVMTPSTCGNGTERCAASLEALGDIDVVVNFQGDAPLTPVGAIPALLAAMHDHRVAVATPAMPASPATYRRLLDDQRAGRVGGTTLVCDARHDAMYFSKAVIPHVPVDRAGDDNLPVRLHLGIYAYRSDALRRYATLPVSSLETLEGLEQLRFLDAGIKVRTVDIPARDDVWELNNPSDVPLVEAALAARGTA